MKNIKEKIPYVFILILIVYIISNNSQPKISASRVESQDKKTVTTTPSSELVTNVGNINGSGLDQQEKCAFDAKKFHESDPDNNSANSSSVYVDYISHYNLKLNRCFILETFSLVDENKLWIKLYDAIEGKTFGSFSGHQYCTIPTVCEMDHGTVYETGDYNTPGEHVGYNANGSYGNENTSVQFSKLIQRFMND